jgi:hypothetical protein
MSCKLISEDISLLIINEENKTHDTTFAKSFKQSPPSHPSVPTMHSLILLALLPTFTYRRHGFVQEFILG